MAPQSAMSTKADEPLLEAFARLILSSEDTRKKEFLCPLICEEIHFHILSGPLGGFFREVFLPERPQARILKAIEYLRMNFRHSTNIDTLCELSCMAPTTFHRNFKEVTSLSPKQFQKILRLQEAKKLIHEFDYSAKSAAEEVGYESPSQFAREFKSYFGVTPLSFAN